MIVPMMRIRIMRMFMGQWIMAMRVRVFAVSTRNLCVFMLVLQRSVRVLVAMIVR